MCIALASKSGKWPKILLVIGFIQHQRRVDQVQNEKTPQQKLIHGTIPFLRIFMREVTSGNKIDNKTGHSIHLRSFLMS